MQSASPLLMKLLAEIAIVALRLADTLENGSKEGIFYTVVSIL
jgi:hypothetical protein